MKVGLLDIIAVGVVVTLLLLPAPERPLEATYTADTARYLPKIAATQADAARRPESGEAAANLAEALLWAGQSDWALRAGGAVATTKSPDRWRAAWALSKVHAGRMEIDPAFRWAKEALAACDEAGSTCEGTSRTFLEMRVEGLQACLRAGVDPKVDKAACFEAVRKIVPQFRAPNPEEKKPEAPKPEAPKPEAPKPEPTPPR